jgi:RES domain-containing protein
MPDELAANWDSGEGAFRFGGRWSSKGVRAVYCAIDPATAILEVAVHQGFPTLDTVAHRLIWLRIHDPSRVRVVLPGEVPNPNWLVAGRVSRGQQEFGDRLLREHAFVAFPSVVCGHAWNLAFLPAVAAGCYVGVGEERFALDGRLHPAP